MSLPGEPGPGPCEPDEHRGGRTFHARKGRLSEAKRRALRDLLPRFALAAGELPAALDLGCGTGEAALSLAADRTDWLVLAVDVHSASIATLLTRASAVAADEPANLRVHHGDGLELLRRRIEPASLRLLRVLFPDPWPKARQRHRRLVQAPFAALVAERLAPGGRLELATDQPDYARQMAAVLDDEGRLGRGPGVGSRAVTFYESRARAVGRTVHELVYQR